MENRYIERYIIAKPKRKAELTKKIARGINNPRYDYWYVIKEKKVDLYKDLNIKLV